MHDIYKMKLHEYLQIEIDNNEVVIIRVPGGWIYKIWYYSGEDKYTTVFVPYHNPGEFK